MNVFRLLYVSRATPKPDLGVLTDLIRVASARNLREGITGVLCWADPFYIQAVEGPIGAVNRLLGRIARDPRHADLTVTSAGPAPLRLFPHWGMRLTAPADAPGGDYARLFPPAASDAPSPVDVDPNVLLAFLCRLVGTVPAAARSQV